MDDKLFDLMTQMYADLKEFKADTAKRFDKLESRFDKLEGQVTIIEVEHGAKIEALLDGYTQLYEGQQEIKADIKELKDKQETQEVQIQVIKGGRKQA